jgi:hypothetical protein
MVTACPEEMSDSTSGLWEGRKKTLGWTTAKLDSVNAKEQPHR